MKPLFALAAVAATLGVAPALAQPRGGGGGFWPPQPRSGGSSEIEELKAKVKELEAKVDRLSGDRRPGPTFTPPARDDRRPGPGGPGGFAWRGDDRRGPGGPPARGGSSSDAIARQFDRIIEELKALKELVAKPQDGPQGRPGFGGGFGGPGGGPGPRR